jgi:hypothetical protein
LIRLAGGYRRVGLFEFAADMFRLIGWDGSEAPIAISQIRHRRAFAPGSWVIFRKPVCILQPLSSKPIIINDSVIVPVTSTTGATLGTLYVESDRADPLSETDAKLVQEFASMLGTLWE